jgi:hypothetical protein
MSVKYRRLLADLAKAVDAADPVRRSRAIAALLNSPSAKVMAAKHALMGKSLVQLKQFAALDLYDIDEPVRTVAIAKPNGGQRLLQIFGPRRKAANNLIAGILKIVLPVNQVEYCERGRGRTAAIGKLRDLMMDPAITHIAVTDVKDFYSTIRGAELVQCLPLPSAVTNGVVLGRTVPQQKEDEAHGCPSGVRAGLPLQGDLPNLTHYPLLAADPQGLPQGAPTSGLIASRVALAGLGALPFQDRLFLYADDMAAGARGMEEAESIRTELGAICASCPVGPLSLTSHIIPKTEAVSFLGYALRFRPLDGDVRIVPDWKSFQRFKAKSAALHAGAEDEGTSYQKWAADDYRDRWLKAFPLCTHDAFLEEAARCAQYEAVPELEPT